MNSGFRGNQRGHYQIGHDGAVLVRPDGYVAWRSVTGHSDGGPLIHAVEEILDRRPATGLSGQANKKGGMWQTMR